MNADREGEGAMRLETLAVHAGAAPDAGTGAVAPSPSGQFQVSSISASGVSSDDRNTSVKRPAGCSIRRRSRSPRPSQ